jgi:hypothetical protein
MAMCVQDVIAEWKAVSLHPELRKGISYIIYLFIHSYALNIETNI